jgi:DNA-directed RNA polymerase subunit K/omega
MVVSTEAPESQFAYVVVVSQRARQLMLGGRPLIDNPRARIHARRRRRIAAGTAGIRGARSDRRDGRRSEEAER